MHSLSDFSRRPYNHLRGQLPFLKHLGDLNMYELGVVYRNIERTDAKTADALAEFGSAAQAVSGEAPGS